MKLCPQCGAAFTPDGRAIRWRVRIRLYDATDTLVADSDAGAPADAAGQLVVLGLPALADELTALCHTFHGVPCVGLERDALLHSVKSLRPTIARRKGNAVWRVSYTVGGREWLARCDIERVVV